MASKIVHRHEKKFPLSYPDYLQLKSLISASLEPDGHAGDDGAYFVRSIYYDTLDDMDYFTKLMGIQHRQKVRARIYSFQSETVKIESKDKDGHLIRKRSDILTRQAYGLFHEGQWHLLDQSLSQGILARLRSDHYRPVVTVDYKREAYVHPFSNIRINFDRDIRWSNTHFDLFDADQPMLPVPQDHDCLMEVKYDHFLPDHLRSLLNQIDVTQSSYSKYCTSRATGG